MRRLTRNGLLLTLLASSMGCHRAPEMAPQIPLAGIDGTYSFTIDNPSIRMEGQFVVAYSQAYLLAPRRCVPIEGPKSSEAMRAAWFECTSGAHARPGDAFLRLRISEIDPINMSRWYARMRVQDTVIRCTRYLASGDCAEILRARGMKWVDRNGTINVVRGLPAATDTSRAPDASGIKRLRARCDTTATTGACNREGKR